MPTTPAMAESVFTASVVPDLNAARPSLKDGNNNLANTPSATGTISVPQSPSGAIVTNTGRSSSATHAYFETLPYRLYRPPLNPYVQP